MGPQGEGEMEGAGPYEKADEKPDGDLSSGEQGSNKGGILGRKLENEGSNH